MRFALLGSLICLCSIPTLIAQDKDADKPRQARGRVAHMVYTSMPEDFENPVKVLTGKDTVEVTLSKRMASEPVKIPEDGIIRIIRPVEKPTDPAKPAFLTLAQAAVPEGMDKVLIILIPVKKKPGSDLVFRTEIQDLATFSGGDYLYLNLTNLNVAVELGKEKLLLKPGETRIYDAPVTDKAANVAIRYSFYDLPQKKWKMLSASTVVLQPTRREICIFSWDPNFGRVDYHGITFPVTE